VLDGSGVCKVVELLLLNTIPTEKISIEQNKVKVKAKMIATKPA
jgi:hypothetical protein